MPEQTNPPGEKANGNDGGLRVIGHARRRVDARAKVTGQTRFADDISLPRMAHCKLLRSPHPHARIRSIDTSRSARMSKRSASITSVTSAILSPP
jgi:CO/xanthine dehydrogenase Mo-binding subunit